MDHGFQITEFLTADARNLCDLMRANQERFRRFLPRTLAQNLSVTASEAYITKKKVERENRTEFTYAIREPIQKKVVGIAILKAINWEQKTGELAYGMGEAFAGKGWMTRTVQHLVAFSFEELRLQTLQIIVHQTNPASIAVAEKCGFSWSKTLPKEHILPGEAALDMELYILHGPKSLTI
jgi:ribosomal-protein-alanine N-acetyltransferase